MQNPAITAGIVATAKIWQSTLGAHPILSILSRYPLTRSRSFIVFHRHVLGYHQFTGPIEMPCCTAGIRIHT